MRLPVTVRPVLLAAALAAGLSAAVAAALHAEESAGITALPTLEERVTKLEKLMNQPTAPPDPTVAAHAASTQPDASTVSLKTPEEVKRAYVQMDARQDTLERRLAAMDNKSRQPGTADDTAKDIADLRRIIEDQRRDLKDIDSRLHRVEQHTGL